MIYLNNSATSYPKPIYVVEAVKNSIESMPFHAQRTGFETQHEDIISTTRKNLAKLFNIKKPENIIFTSGATESLNLAIKGVGFHRDHVITTNIEHNSVLRPLKTLEKKGIVNITIVNSDELGFINPESIKKHLTKNTKALIINHSSNVIGTIQDIKTIADIAHENNSIIIVDASQSAGAYPIDVTATGIDLMAFTGHKSLYGLQGIGGLYIKDGISLEPLKTGGTGIKSDYLYQPADLPIYYEAGTYNIAGIASLNAGVKYIFKEGMEKINQLKTILFNKIIDGLKQIPNIVIYGSDNLFNRLPIISFNIKNLSPEDVGYILEHSFNIIIRSGLHCAPLIHKSLGSYPQGSVRASPSQFNSGKEIDNFIDAISQISREAQKM